MSRNMMAKLVTVSTIAGGDGVKSHHPLDFPSYFVCSYHIYLAGWMYMPYPNKVSDNLIAPYYNFLLIPKMFKLRQNNIFQITSKSYV